MKQSIEKWTQSLQAQTEEVSKRYKALVSLKKAFKDQVSEENLYPSIINENNQHVFTIITEKITKIPTSTFEKMLTMTASSTVQLNELLEFLHDLFTFIEVGKLKDLLDRNKIKIVVILYKFLDNTTKIDIRRMSFYFLLKILDSFDNIQAADPEYIALFNYALDHPLLRENSQKPAYHLFYLGSHLQHTTMSQKFNEYQSYFSSFQELNKVITESSSIAKSEKNFEEIFHAFMNFVRGNKTKKPRHWFVFFKSTWKDIYFNETEGIPEDITNLGVFEESKKRGMTSNLSLMKMCISFFESILRDQFFTMSKDDLFVIMDSMKYFYWNINLKNEVNKVLRIYCDFVSTRIRFKTDEDCDDAIRRKIIESLDEICFNSFLQDLAYLSHSNEGYEIITSKEENLCLSIFNEFIKQYNNKYAKDIFKTAKFTLQRSLQQNGASAKDYLYPLIEIVLLITVKAEPSERSEFRATLKQYLEYKEIVAKVNSFLLKKTETFVANYYSDINYEIIKYMEIENGPKTYPMKIEYLYQYLLQKYCQENKQKNYEEYKYFENDANSDRILKVKVNDELYSKEELIKALKNLENKFNEWLTFIIILYDLDLLKSKGIFPLFCHGFNEIIHVLIEPDSIAAFASNSDRSKQSSKPKYSLPTETLYQMFGTFFTTGLNTPQEKNKIEGRLWTIKAYLKVFCNTQSEILTTKSLIIDMISFINSALKSFYLREDDIDAFATVCIILKYTEQIFLTDYPGIKILIPSYLKIIEYVLTNEKFGQLYQSARQTLERIVLVETVKFEQYKIDTFKPDAQFAGGIIVKNSALNILKSILFMGYALPDMKIVSLGESKANKMPGSQSSRTMEMIREKAFTITYKMMERMKDLKSRGTKASLNVENGDVELQYNIFTISTLIVYLECDNSTKQKDGFLNISLEDFIDSYIQQFCFDLNTMHQEHLMLHIQAAGTLATIITSDMKFYPVIFKQVISRLTSALSSIASGKHVNPQKKELAAELFFVLLKWVLNDKKGVLIKEDIAKGLINMMVSFSLLHDYREIFDMFFNNIMINYMNFPLKNQDKDNTKSIFEETVFKNLSLEYLNYIQPKQLKEAGGDWQRASIIMPTEEYKLAAEKKLKNQHEFEFDVQDLDESREKKENLLALFTFLPISHEERQRMLHYKEKEIIDNLNSIMNSFNTETQQNDVLYFTFKEHTLISAAGASSRSIGGRVIFRNMTGRFAWEFSYIQALGTKSIENGLKTFDDINQKTFTVSSASLFSPGPGSEENQAEAEEKQMAQLRVDVNTESGSHRDIFNELFEYIKEHVSDYVEYNLDPMASSNESFKSLHDPFEEKYDFAKNFEDQKKKRMEKANTHEANRKRDEQESGDEIIQDQRVFHLAENNLNLSNFDGVRMFLANLGFLTPFRNMDLSVFDKEKVNAHLQTSINLLDSALARETIKIGVLYCARGQDHQRDILKNTVGSNKYEDFINHLGEKVSLRNHLGFTAGLKYKTDGKVAVYHSDPLIELMFHVATMMPTAADDDQVLNKKKHVGNDHVNIVWCENYRGYRRNTVTSQYNFVQIIIYPMKFDLCKVVVYKKEPINYLFPWIDNMIISRSHLPLLVKLCSIHGFRKSKIQKDLPFKSYQKRSEYLKQFGLTDHQGSVGQSQFRKKSDAFSIVSSLLIN